LLNIVEGNLLDATETYLCHQCNCVTRRSKHLSKTVFTQFPYADIYSARQKPAQPGTVDIKGNGTIQRYIINMLGQYYQGCPNSIKDRPDARIGFFKSCLDKMKILQGDFAFPWRIGCGAAGGNWNDYLLLIQNFEKEIDGNVTIYKLVQLAQVQPVTLF